MVAPAGAGRFDSGPGDQPPRWRCSRPAGAGERVQAPLEETMNQNINTSPIVRVVVALSDSAIIEAAKCGRRVPRVLDLVEDPASPETVAAAVAAGARILPDGTLVVVGPGVHAGAGATPSECYAGEWARWAAVPATVVEALVLGAGARAAHDAEEAAQKAERAAREWATLPVGRRIGRFVGGWEVGGAGRTEAAARVVPEAVREAEKAAREADAREKATREAREAREAEARAEKLRRHEEAVAAFEAFGRSLGIARIILGLDAGYDMCSTILDEAARLAADPDDVYEPDSIVDYEQRPNPSEKALGRLSEVRESVRAATIGWPTCICLEELGILRVETTTGYTKLTRIGWRITAPDVFGGERFLVWAAE